MYFAIYTSCNKITPQIVAIGDSQEAIETIICQGIDAEVDSLTVYKDEEEQRTENEEHLEKESVDQDAEAHENTVSQAISAEYDTPYAVADVPYRHVVSYVITFEQSSKLFAESLEATQHARSVKCQCSETIISIFKTDNKAVNLIDVISSLNIL